MNGILIAQIILGIGAFIFLVLILRSKWLQSRKNIKDYQEGRDKLTHRKKKEEKVEYSGGFSLSSLISGFITLLVGASLIGPISEQVNIVAQESGAVYNASSLGATVLKIFPGLFVIVVAMVSIGIVWSNIRDSGLV